MENLDLKPRPVLTVEHALYLALFALALSLRLFQLNAHPLNDAEAREALSVFRLLHGQAAAILPHSPAYFFFTYFSFLLFDASNATARLAPALFGAGLVFLPLFFRDHLGRAGALTAGGLLAVSAGLLAASRSADGAVIALFALGLSLGALRRCLATASSVWLVTCAAALGLGLASGAAFLTGLSILAVTALVMTWLHPDEREAVGAAWAKVREQGLTFFIALGVTLGVVTTVGLVYRSGLGALAGSEQAWLAGFAPTTAGRAPLTLWVFLLVYEPLPLVFGLVGAALAFRRGHRFGQWLFWFFLVAQAFAMVYSGRSLFDLIWIITPLAALAGWALVEIVRGAWAADREAWPLAAAQAGVVVALLGFAALQLAEFVEALRQNPDLAQSRFTFSGLTTEAPAAAHVYLALTAVGLAFVVSYLFGLGWSPHAARLGLTLSGAAALLAVSVGAGWGLTQLRPTSPVELWWEQPVSDDLNRLMETLGNVSNYSVGNAHDMQVTVQASPDGALGWALRDFPHAVFVAELDPLVDSPAVVAPASPTGEQNPTLGSTYVGQGFAFRSVWSPAGLTWPQQVAWLTFRRTPAPVPAEQVILWVRQDVAQLQDAGPAP